MSMLTRTIETIYPQDTACREVARSKLENLSIPYRGLGYLKDLAVDLAGITRDICPSVKRKVIITMAGDHGIVEENVARCSTEPTIQRVLNCLQGGSAVNSLARIAGAELYLVDMGIAEDLGKLTDSKKVINKKVGLGTGNIANGPAMSKAMATRGVESGIDVVNELADRFDVFGTGDIGMCNSISAAAIASICTGQSVAEVADRGACMNDTQYRHEIEVIERALQRNIANEKDGLDILAKVGGFEISGITGVVLGAAANKKPVLIDGFVSTAAALIACKIEPFVKDYLVFAHSANGKGQKLMQDMLGCNKPLIDLDFRLGDGSGAAIAMSLLEAAAVFLSEVATVSETAAEYKDI